MERSLDILRDRHIILMIMYVYDPGPCRKSDLYNDVSRNVNIQKSLIGWPRRTF